jgi:N,N'-diacetyllegionaminate synthase
MEPLNLHGRRVGPGHSPYIIAEIGANYNGDMDLCRRMIDVAHDCGADAVKFQSWSKTSLICRAEYERNTSYADKNRHFGSLEEMVERYQLTPDQHREVAAYCRGRGIAFTSTPFSPEEVDLLESLDVPCFKVASMDINHLKLLNHIGSKGRPVVLSTGMATLGEIERALSTLRASGSGPIALLHCISIYPPAAGDIHLRNIPMLERTFDLPVGFSDHTLGVSVPLAAVALGACIVEKHFTLDKEMDGWDHWISADPPEFKTLVEQSKIVFESLGSSVRTVSSAEMEKRLKFRRRVVLKRAMKKGEVLAEADLDFKRPGNGIHPDEAQYIVGRRLKRDCAFDEELGWGDLE